MKLIQITDPHQVPPGERLFGLDPRARLDAVVAAINANHADARLCVVSGDLTEEGQVEAYGQLREALAPLRIPCALMIGNHDDRANFLQVFPETPTDAHGFVQQAIETEQGTLLLLDTHEPGVHSGSYCARRLRWLAAALERAGDAPVYLFLHHPPFPIHIARLDEMALLEPEPLAALLAGRANIRHLFFGHVHRPIAGSWQGIPISALRGTNHLGQSDLQVRWTEMPPPKPPALGVIFIEPGQTLIHLREIGPEREQIG